MRNGKSRRVNLALFGSVALALVSASAQAQDNTDNVGPLPEVVGAPRSVQVVPAFGAVSETIPIVVSPGRRNVQPQLALSYNSMGGLGDIGLGWDVGGIGFVARWRGDGTPTVGNAGAFSYALAGAGGELRSTGNGVYRAKMESVYREFRFVEQGPNGQGYWVMDNGEGVKHYFGFSPNSRIAGELWMLEYAIDGSGNMITYHYMSHAGTLYIETIQYTGYAPTGTPGPACTPGPHRVEFAYEDRPPGDVRISYGNSVREERRKRLTSIAVVTAENKLVRRYELVYDESALNGQSLLRQVELVGADGTSRIVLRTLAYGSRSLEPSVAVLNSLPVDLAVEDSDFGGGRETGARLVDVNGDGFVDVVDNEAAAGLHRVYLGDGTGGFEQNDAWSTSLTAAGVRFIVPDGDFKGADEGVRLLDVNADALPDLFIAQPARREVWINTGVGWQWDEGWTQELPEKETVFVDSYFTQTDCLRFHCDDPKYAGDPTCIPHCQGTEADPPGCVPLHCQGTEDDPEDCLELDHCQSSAELYDEPFALVEDVDAGYASKGVQLADVNADGRVDIIWSMTRSDVLFTLEALGLVPLQIRAVYLNTGSGWQKNQPLTNALIAIAGDYGVEFVIDSELQGYALMDVNGDGLADIVGTSEGSQAVYFGTGGGWVYDDPDDGLYSASLVNKGIISLNSDRQGQGLMPTDFNDDGLVDYLRANGTVTQAYHNTGTGWEESAPMTAVLNAHGIAFNTSEGKATGTVLTDIDGDGISDFVTAKDGTSWLSLSSSLRANLLVGSTSAVGEETELEWDISTSLDNTRADGIEGLPVSRPIPTQVMRHDGRGNIYLTSYNYSGGLFENRQFRGFARSEQTLPTGLSLVSMYHQEEGLAGFSFLTEKKTEDGFVFARHVSEYALTDTSIGKQILFLQRDEEMIDPEGALHSRLQYTYDAKMNVTSVYRDPEVGQSGDETTTVFTWASNEEAGIWSLPARTTAVEGESGPVLSEFIMYYDNLPEGEAWRGLPNKRRSLVETGESEETGTYIEKTMAYDQYGNVISITDGEGNTATFEYDDLTTTYRTRALDQMGRVVESEYDVGFGRILSDKDASGNETVKEYDVFGRLTRVTLPGDEQSPFGTRTYEYSDLGDPEAQCFRVKETETPGDSSTLDTTNYFDGLGRVFEVARDGPADRKIIMWTEYDDADNPVATTRPYFAGDVELITTIERDALHRPIRIIEPDNSELSFYYAGDRTDVVDQRGVKTSFYRHFDAKVTEIHRWVEAEEQVTHYRYDPLGRLTEIEDALGTVTSIVYDALSRRVVFEDPNTGTYTYEYDGEGRLIAQTDPAGLTTQFLYNGAGDLLRKVFPDGTAHHFTFGEEGAVNAVGRLIRVADAAGLVEMSYDLRGNVVERKRSVRGRTYVTGYAYDSLGRIRRTTYPDGFTVHYEYDAGGNLSRIADGENREIAAYTDHTASGQLIEIRFGNDVNSRFTYDDLLRMTSIDTWGNGGETLQGLHYTYDPAGNIQSIEDSAYGVPQDFEYDAIGRLTRAVGPYGEEHYEYDAIGNLLRKGSLTFTLDPLSPQRATCGIDTSHSVGRGTGKNPHVGACEASDASAFRSFRLAYDERGNLIQKGGTLFEYDPENRLIGVLAATGNSENPARLLVENVYGAGGQRIIQKTRNDTTVFIDGIYEENKTHASRHVRAGPLLVATIMTPRTAVRLIDTAPPALYGLDGAGPHWNLVAMAGHSPWILMIFPSFAAFGYFQSPARRRKWRRYLAVLAENASEMQRRPFKTAFVMLFVPLYLVTWSTQVWAAAEKMRAGESPPSEKRYYYHSNHLGSVNLVTDDRGQVIERRDYKPYGDRFDWTGPNSGPRELPYTFNGQRFDDATGLYYFGARHYDPEIGRFITADTQVPDPMNPKTLHRYAFAGGNPIKYQDPTGHGWFDWVLAIVVIVVLVVVGVVTAGVGLAVLFGASIAVTSTIAISGALAGAALLIFGGAALGAAVFGGIFLGRVSGGFGGEFSFADFGLALAAGAIIGAAVGASFAALPYSLGTTWSFGFAGFWSGLAADTFIGAVLGGLGAVGDLLSGGAGPEQILTAAIGEQLLTSVFKGALFGLTTGFVLNKVGAFSWAGRMFAALATLGLTAESAAEVWGSGTLPDTKFSFLDIFGSDANWFRNSPANTLGIPHWAFEGTWLGFGNDRANGNLAPLLQTMPLAP